MRLIVITCLCTLLSSALNQEKVDIIATIDIHSMDFRQVELLKSNSHFKWWSQLGDTMVVGGKKVELGQSGFQFEQSWANLRASDLDVIIAGHRSERPESIKAIAKSGRITLAIHNDRLQSDGHMQVTLFKPNHVYVQAARHDSNVMKLKSSQISNVKSIMDEVDDVRWYGDVVQLSNWNRHVSSVDIVSARDWIKGQFDSLHPSSTQLQKFSVGGRDGWNVLATFDGPQNSDIYIVGGHYDSTSEQTSRLAPGAEDNASGAAGVIEMARAFSGKKLGATLIFIAFSGEEQGLVGSKAYVRSLPADIKARIKGVITMDMIGYSKDDSEDVLLETASKFRDFSSQFAAAAQLVPGLNYYTTFNPFGSDHMPFIDNDIPAILTIDNDWDDYPAYHRTSDTIDKVSRQMGLAILRMNVAALAVMIGKEAIDPV